MRPKGSADLIADRRKRALSLLKKGFSLNEVARQIGCHASSVMRWRDEHKKKGKAAFEVRFSSGRPPKIAKHQLKKLEQYLLKGAIAFGYSTDLWTTRRIAELIEEKFNIRYHRDHIGRLMAKMGWSHQKPERRALERDEKRIQRWKDEVWPSVKKTPPGWVPISSS